jgi:hypothetical protein
MERDEPRPGLALVREVGGGAKNPPEVAGGGASILPVPVPVFVFVKIDEGASMRVGYGACRCAAHAY